MTAYAGGPQIQNYLDPERPDYGAILLSGAESTSALEQALMKLNSEVQGTETIFDARVKAAKMGAADASRIAGAETFAAGVGAIGTAASGFIGAIPTGGGGNMFRDPIATDIAIDHSTDTGSALGEAFRNDGGGLYWDSDMPVNKSILRNFPS